MLEIFELFHSINVEGKVTRKDKSIGFFRSLEYAKEALEKFKNKEGFRDFPDGFKIASYILDQTQIDKQILFQNEIKSKNIKDEKIFALYSVKNDDLYEDEAKILGVYSSLTNANLIKKKLERSELLNNKMLHLAVYDYKIGRLGWSEGFVTLA